MSCKPATLCRSTADASSLAEQTALVSTGAYGLIGVGTLMVKALDADPLVLLKTVAHCHARHVTSLVFEEAQGCLRRAFLVWPDHQLWRNDPYTDCFEVGIHDHRYGVALQHVAGTVRNDLYEIQQDGRLQTGGRVLNHFTFATGHMRGPCRVNRQLQQRLLLIDRRLLQPGIWQTMDYQQLHTIWVPEGQPAAWVVYAGAACRQHTNLYTTREQIPLEGLYEPFPSRQAILDHVDEFCNLEFPDAYRPPSPVV